jgi:AAA+ superfamily predicted ATPase
MFSEIRRSERITEKTEKEKEVEYWQRRLFDTLVGSEESKKILRILDELENEPMPVQQAFDPDQLIQVF